MKRRNAAYVVFIKYINMTKFKFYTYKLINVIPVLKFSKGSPKLCSNVRSAINV